MNLSFVKPRVELLPYVESLWIFESSTGLPAADHAMAAPNGCCKLTFAYGNSFLSIANGTAMFRPQERLNFVGNRDSAILLQSECQEIGCIGIEFRPHGAFPVLGIPMRDTLNFRGGADIVLGKWADRAQRVLGDLQDVGERVAFLQSQLVVLLRQNESSPLVRKHRHDNDVVGYCVAALKRADGRIPVRELERRTGYSRRYLDLLFGEHVGLSPKVLAGIFRFQRFYQQWARGLSFDLLRKDLYDYYYDQSHFTKEFKKMTGQSPRRYTQEVSNEFGRLVSRR